MALYGRRLLVGLWALVAVVCGMIGFGGEARAQVTNAEVIAACTTSRALPDGTWTYNFAHTGWTDVQWNVEDPFPGEFSDIRIEVVVTAKPVFTCMPANAQGQNPQNLPAFAVTLQKTGKALLGDELICAYDSASNSWKMTFAFPGAACQWTLTSGIPISNYSQPGTYATTQTTPVGAPNCVVNHPSQMGTGTAALNGKVRHPIILFVPGQGGSAASYPNSLAFFASHGYVVVTAQSNNAASPTPVLNCMNFMLDEQENANSVFYRKLNIYNIGVMGHQEGAAGALMAGRDRFITGTVLVDPRISGIAGFDSASIKQQWAHTWIIAGALDTQAPPASNAQVIFDQSEFAAFYALDPSGDHLITPKDAGAAVPAFAWLLAKDTLQAPRFYFPPTCSLCTNGQWTVQRKGDFLVP